MDYNLDSLLSRFDKLKQQWPGPIPDSITFGAKGTPHLVVGLIVHGNEVGSLPVAINFMERLAKENQNTPYSLTFFLGNRKAAVLGKRFVEEDLNRMFHNNAPPSLETARAQELKGLLNTADLFLDVHQAYRPSPYPFYIFAQHSPSDLWARTLASAPVWVTRASQEPYVANLLCADEWVREMGKPAVTLELGYFGFSEQADGAMEKLLSQALGAWQLTSNGYTTLEELSNQSAPLKLLWPSGSLLFESDFDKLLEGFNNFDVVKKGQILGFRGDGVEILSPTDGYVLFPQYPKREESGKKIGHSPKEIVKFVGEK